METLAKNQTHIAEITGYSSSGAGVCRIVGRAVFVDFAIFGEVWEVLILKVTASAVFGKGIRLIAPSKERQEPACPVFGKCGGCDMLHMSYDEELRFKLLRVNDAIERIAGLDYRLTEIIAADANARFRYRNKAIFNFSYDENGRVVSGFFRRRSHDLVKTQDCLISTEIAVHAASALCGLMNESKIPLYDEKTGRGALRHLFVRSSLRRPDACAVIVSAKGFGSRTSQLIEALKTACPELTGIVLCINKAEGNVVLSGEYHTLWGSEFITDELCGLEFDISPESFYQINPPQAEKLYQKALEYAAGGESGTVLDLYCGTGTITLCLSRVADMVYGAEIVEAAVENARQNALRNGIRNVEFICGDAEEAARTLASRGVSPGTVVVDPPRRGLAPGLIETIAGISPERVVYVSCDPGTLARDLKLFAENGYKLTTATAVDMFPGTCHVETAALLRRSN